MAASSTARCLFCRLLPRPAFSPSAGRQFSISRPRQAAKKSYPSIKASDTRTKHDTADDDSLHSTSSSPVQPYTEREKKLLALKYTPAQLRSIEAGESAINPDDLLRQGRRRTEPMTLEYRDDFSRILPAVDKPVRALDEDVDPDIRMRSELETTWRFGEMLEEIADQDDEFQERDLSKNRHEKTADIQRFVQEAAISPDDGRTPQQRMAKFREVLEYAYGPDMPSRYAQFTSDMDNFIFSPKGTPNSQSSSLSVDLPRTEDKHYVYESSNDVGPLDALSKRTGMSLAELRNLRVKRLVSHRVTNQTRMGKIQGFYVLTIAGDGQGRLGLGEGNNSEPLQATRQAHRLAILNMKPIPRYENRTIFGDIEGKVGASIVQLSSRPPGKYRVLVQPASSCKAHTPL